MTRENQTIAGMIRNREYMLQKASLQSEINSNKYQGLKPKVKELIEQCTNPERTTPWPLIDYEKFAELIITKCAVIATRCEANGTKNIAAEILESFGVE